MVSGNLRFDFVEQLEAVHLGHSPIAQHEIERPVTVRESKCFTSAFGDRNFVVVRAQKAAEGVANIFFVVNDKQFCHLDAPRAAAAGRRTCCPYAEESRKIRPRCASTISLAIARPKARMAAFKAVRSPLCCSKTSVAEFRPESPVRYPPPIFAAIVRPAIGGDLDRTAFRSVAKRIADQSREHPGKFHGIAIRLELRSDVYAAVRLPFVRPAIENFFATEVTSLAKSKVTFLTAIEVVSSRVTFKRLSDKSRMRAKSSTTVSMISCCFGSDVFL